MFKRLFTAAILFGVAATAPPALAQTPSCALRDIVVERLTQNFGELPVAGGLQNSHSIIEIWASDQTGTFTVLISRADGFSCVVSTGTGFHHKQPELMKPDIAG